MAPSKEPAIPEEDNAKESPPRLDLESVIRDLEDSIEGEDPQARLDLFEETEPQAYTIEANSSGLRRLAAALLRLDQLEEKYNLGIDERVSNLTPDHDSTYISGIVRTDGEVPEEIEGESEGCGTVVQGIGCVMILISIPVFWIIGMRPFIVWLIGWWIE